MKPVNLLVIAPYEGLSEVVKNVISTKDDVTADYFVANLDEALSVIQNLNLLNYDAILSRGGTASLLDKNTNLPVFDIGISALDALRSIRLAQNFNQEIALVGFAGITNTMHMICEAMQWTIPIVTIKKAEDVANTLKKLKDSGINVVVCDVITSLIAPTLGLDAILVSSGYETVEEVLDLCTRLTREFNDDRMFKSHMINHFESSPYACSVFDSENNLVISSLKTSDPKNSLPFVCDNIQSFRKETVHEFERPFHGGILAVYLVKKTFSNMDYLYVYTRAHSRTEIRKISAIQQLHSANDELLDFSYYNISHFQAFTQEQITAFGKTLTPIIISGENGVGKDRAAYYIYCRSAYRSSVFYQIDCEVATDRDWNFLFSHHSSPLMRNKHTLYFRHVNAMGEQNYGRLISFIADTNLSQRNRLMFSFATGDDEDRTRSYTSLLVRNMSSLTMHISALRERTEDIPMLCSYYINRLNKKLNKQIIGFDEKALHAMKSFLWVGNLDEFQRILEELMLVTESSYITYENTMKKLSQENSLWLAPEMNGLQFNLNQTLEEINCDIAQAVLKEENGNHTKAAQRLGISRSTLWRMLKD